MAVLYDRLRAPRRGGLRGRPDQSDQGSPFGRIVAQSCIDLVRHQQRRAVQIHNSLKRHLLEGDKLAVVQCGNWGAWSGFNDEASEWLTNALKNEA